MYTKFHPMGMGCMTNMHCVRTMEGISCIWGIYGASAPIQLRIDKRLVTHRVTIQLMMDN